MFRKSVAALGVAALTGAGTLVALPQAQAKSLPQAQAKSSSAVAGVRLAACSPANPCAAKANPCAAKASTNPCAAKNAANPCAAKPANPCAAKK